MKFFEAAKDSSGPSRRDFIRAAGAFVGSWQQVVTALASSKPVDLIIQTSGMDDDDTFESIGWLAEKLMKTFGTLTNKNVKDIKGGTSEGYYGHMPELQGTLSSEKLQEFIKSLGKNVRIRNNMEEVAKELKSNVEQLAKMKPGDPSYDWIKTNIASARKALSDGTVSIDIHDFKNDITYRIFNKGEVRAGRYILNRKMEYSEPIKNVRDLLKIPIDMKFPDGVNPYDWNKMSDLDKKVLAQGDPKMYGRAQKDFEQYNKEVERYNQEQSAKEAERASREEKWGQEQKKRTAKERERRKEEIDRERKKEANRQRQFNRKEAERMGARFGGESGMHQNYDEPDWKSFKSFLASPDIKDIYVQRNILKRGRPELWS